MNKGDNESGVKFQERRLKWDGHVMRRDEHSVGRRATGMKVRGRRGGGEEEKAWRTYSRLCLFTNQLNSCERIRPRLNRVHCHDTIQTLKPPDG